MRTLSLLIVILFTGITANGQTKQAPIPKNIPEIPFVDGERGYRRVITIQDSSKRLYQELQLFLSNKYNSAKDVIDLSLDVTDQSTGIIVSKGKFQIATNDYSVLGKKYYKNITSYLVDHKITFEIKDNRVRATLNSFLVQQPPLDYSVVYMGDPIRINYPKRTIQEVIDFTKLSFLGNSIWERIDIAKRYAFSDFLNSFHSLCEDYLEEVEVFLNQKKDNW